MIGQSGRNKTGDCWHSVWHSFWHSIWHLCWHSLRQGIWSSRLRSGSSRWDLELAVGRRRKEGRKEGKPLTRNGHKYPKSPQNRSNWHIGQQFNSWVVESKLWLGCMSWRLPQARPALSNLKSWSTNITMKNTSLHWKGKHHCFNLIHVRFMKCYYYVKARS